MKITRRISAIVLSVVMILSMMPVMAFAEDDNAAAGTAAADEIAVEDTAADTAEDEAEDTAEDTDAVEPEGQVTEESGETGAGDEVIEEGSEEGSDVDEEALTEEDPEEEAGEEVYDESDMGVGVASFGDGVDAEDIDGTEPEEQVEEFLFSEEEEEEQDGLAPKRLMSVKGDRLTGNDLKYYNYYKKIIKEIMAGTRSNAYTTVKASTFLGKRTFTASQLGVSKIGYKKDGKWYVTEAAKKKIDALYNPINWKRVYTCVLSDMPNSTYWVDWYASGRFFDWECEYSYNTTKLVFKEDSELQFRLPVMPEFTKDAGGSDVYVYKVSQDKLASAKQAKDVARYIVNSFSQYVDTSGKTRAQVDLLKLWYYCDYIAYLTEYDQEVVDNTNLTRTTPWSFVSVLDGDTSTKAVCAGYARAFKYLCDLSKFNSNWIDCQLVSGKVGTVGHMWNLVRMDDGLNYVVDPTWLDAGTEADQNLTWFLRGDPNGTANSYTIDGSTRVYDEWTKATFPIGERQISKKSYYQFGSTRTIKLKTPTIYTPLRGRKKLTVKWKKVTSHLGALYVDGYQIRYSTKSSMSNAKKVKVKGYNKKSKVIKSLRAKKYYYVQVRTYAKLGGKTYYSKWSKKKKVRTR